MSTRRRESTPAAAPTSDVDSRSGEPPADEAALQQEIEATREQLGETVAALAAKTDIKARSKEAAAQATGRVAGTAHRAGALTREKAASTAAAARGQAAPAVDAVSAHARTAASTVRRRPALVAGALAALSALGVLTRRLTRR